VDLFLPEAEFRPGHIILPKVPQTSLSWCSNSWVVEPRSHSCPGEVLRNHSFDLVFSEKKICFNPLSELWCSAHVLFTWGVTWSIIVTVYTVKHSKKSLVRANVSTKEAESSLGWISLTTFGVFLDSCSLITYFIVTTRVKKNIKYLMSKKNVFMKGTL
jgi:hypothetical protein